MPEALVRVEHLTHLFQLTKKTAVRAVDDLSFEIRKGEIFGLVGESGCGKSTAARCIMNICRPASGRVVYDGIDTCDPAQYRAHKKGWRPSGRSSFRIPPPASTSA